jgi:4-hydroxy-tetrahydrodipicolinate reductase
MKREPVGILLHGAAGRMGRAIADLAPRVAGVRIEGALELRADRGRTAELEARGLRVFESVPTGAGRRVVVVDFSRKDAVGPLAKALSGSAIPLVCGTTGIGQAERKLLDLYSEKTPVFYDSNMSYGISLLRKLLGVAAPLVSGVADVEIVEFHHGGKADFPSGTASTLARAVRPDATTVAGRGDFARPDPGRVHIHSVRIGGVTGDHEVHLGMEHEVLTLSHRALSREVFARGAIRAAQFIVGKDRGFFTMNDLLEVEGSA